MNSDSNIHLIHTFVCAILYRYRRKASPGKANLIYCESGKKGILLFSFCDVLGPCGYGNHMVLGYKFTVLFMGHNPYITKIIINLFFAFCLSLTKCSDLLSYKSS